MVKKKVKTYNLDLRKKIDCHFKGLRRYLLVVLVNTVLLFLTLYVFSSIFDFHYFLSLAVAYVIMITNSFLCNRYWIFNGFNPKRFHKMYLEFFWISVAAFFANLVFLFVLTDVLDIYYLFSQLIIGLVGFPLLFTFYKRIVFSHR